MSESESVLNIQFANRLKMHLRSQGRARRERVGGDKGETPRTERPKCSAQVSCSSQATPSQHWLLGAGRCLVAHVRNPQSSTLTCALLQGRLPTLVVVARLHAHTRGGGLGSDIPLGVCLGPWHTNQSIHVSQEAPSTCGPLWCGHSAHHSPSVRSSAHTVLNNILATGREGSKNREPLNWKRRNRLHPGEGGSAIPA